MIARYLLVALALVFAASAHAGEKNGNSIYPRTLDEIKKALAKILGPDEKNADENTLALRRLKAYRYLSELAYADVTLDENYNKMCVAGAKFCEQIGKLDHKPKNPGLPEAEFKFAYQGTSQSNLAKGYPSTAKAVDGWMDDSDASNIDRLGHRRWCLNPTMQKTGFGRSGVYFAMFSFDRNRKKGPDWDMVCYPARGFMPIEFFGANRAWSVTLDPDKYKTPAKDFLPKIFRANEKGVKQGEALTLNYKNVNTSNFGVPNCIIFRPEKLTLESGERYVVELNGIQRHGVNQSVSLRYVVEFVDLK